MQSRNDDHGPCVFGHHAHPHGQARSRSSWRIHDAERIFRELALAPGMTFLDLGCGPGDYALRAAELVGPDGTVLAVDRSPETTGMVARRAAERGLGNVRAMVRDIAAPLPLDDAIADRCLLCTVLHSADLLGPGTRVLREARRLLAPRGELAVVEIKKAPMPFGPPQHLRIPEDRLRAVAAACGLQARASVDLGYTYMVVFRVAPPIR